MSIFPYSPRKIIVQLNKFCAMIVMGNTITGAASGETDIICGAEGFTISGKRTEE